VFQAAEYFSTVQEVGATMTGPLVDAVMVAAGCNCALAEERAGHKMQALRTMRRLNARVRRYEMRERWRDGVEVTTEPKTRYGAQQEFRRRWKRLFGVNWMD
jgi:hypothetical protein